MELLPFVDILKVFNNPINEEQAWAVCYQCANYLLHNKQQEYYQFVFDYGIHSVWLSRQGDVLLRKRPPDPNGSGKGPPQSNEPGPNSSSVSTTVLAKRKQHVHATETDAVQALGTAIFEALDYGIDPTEERQLSQGLESLIITMTNADNSLESDADALNADDEGIEKDADIEHRCTVKDVLKMCSQHLSSKQDAQHHYKAVCRALATEAGELFTFLEKITSCKERLSDCQDEDSKRLEELQKADWACLWVQVMRSLRQGVRLKKVSNINLPPVEYELTPFEILLEDIRSRRYTLHKIMVDGEIPHKVKDNAQAVILDFIRSRPPLKKVNERKLKPKPAPAPDPHERLLKEIRAKPTLRPVRSGKLLVGTSGSRLSSDDDQEPPHRVKRVIKPDLSLLLNSSFEESSEDDDHLADSSLSSSPSSPCNSNTRSPMSSWQKSGDGGGHRPTRLQRRHTIMVCESSTDRQVAAQELPPLEEEEEPSPVRESHHFSHHSVHKPAQNTTVLSRVTYSDNDFCNQVTMRHPQGHQKRSSLEHRRSLTSLTSDLCAIPELDDGLGVTDSPTRSQGIMLRSWSHEQAPPPNPSPPCKGRARAALGMSMKSMGASHHPGPHKPLSSPFNQPPTTTQSTSSGPTANPVQTTIPVFNSQNVITSPSKYTSTSAFPSSLSSNNSGILDPTASSQSPGYSRKLLLSQKNTNLRNGTSSVEHSGFERNAERWRHSNSRSERLNSYKQSRNMSSDANNSASWDANNSASRDANNSASWDTTDSASWDDNKGLSEAQLQHSLLSKEAHHRRLSLDSGLGMYKDGGNVISETAGCNLQNKTPRRRSIGVHRKVRVEDADSFIVRRKSPDDEERLHRWRVLQSEDLASRSRRAGKNVTTLQTDFTEDPIQHFPELRFKHNSRRDDSSQQAPYSLKIDVFQQKMADEEARFARWRHLEETGQFGTLPEDVSRLSIADKDYVSDVLSAKLQPAAHANSVSTASNIPPVNAVFPLPKRWQNPVECLSLTLEEVTHIRTVLTKAELESLISHPDLYQQVSKSKLCFTCKTTRFSLFGEWGTKCKFCKRTVCSSCMRKMSVPADEFKHIPVYTLCPSPLTPEMQESVQNFIKTGSPSSAKPFPDPGSDRNTTVPDQPQNHQEEQTSPSFVPGTEHDSKSATGAFPRSKPLQRSQSLFVPGHKPVPGTPRTSKGPSIAICCDCKGMLKEIIRATQASLAMLASPTAVTPSNTHPTLSQFKSINLTRN